MNEKKMPESCLKPVCSVIEMAAALQLSRARFYQLVEAGVFPAPVYDIRTKRPYYTVELQQICQRVRQTNIGHNALPVLFYSSRQKISEPNPKTVKPSKKRKGTPDPIFQELAASLQTMGIRDATEERVTESFKKLHPNQTPKGMDAGMLFRELFRHFRQEITT